MTIYIDIIFLENIIMNYILLYSSLLLFKRGKNGNIKKEKKKEKKREKIRILIGAIIGATYTVCTYIFMVENSLSSIVKILMSIFIVYISFNPQNIQQMWKGLMVFYLVSFVFGGAAFAVIYYINDTGISQILNLELTIFIITILIGIYLINMLVKIMRSRISKDDIYCEIEVYLEGKKTKCKAMIDTGNFLKEPISGTSVVILEKEKLENCISSDILNNLVEIVKGDFSKIDKEIQQKYITKLKIIPFSSLGNPNGILLGIKCERLRIIQKDETRNIEEVIIGIYDKELTKSKKYCALIGTELLN